jgi:hypothetical protein
MIASDVWHHVQVADQPFKRMHVRGGWAAEAQSDLFG